jgi:hypothetical protein
LIDKISAEGESDLDEPLKRKRNETLYEKLLLGKLVHVGDEDRRHIESALKKYTHLFHNGEENYFKCTNVMERKIQVCDVKPTRKQPYRFPYALRQEILDQDKRWLIRTRFELQIRRGLSPLFWYRKRRNLIENLSTGFVSILEI